MRLLISADGHSLATHEFSQPGPLAALLDHTCDLLYVDVGAWLIHAADQLMCDPHTVSMRLERGDLLFEVTA